MTPAPKRRWSFSLRTLFVVVTAVSCCAGWAVYQMRWIQQRHEFTARHRARESLIPFDPNRQIVCGFGYAPGLLWVFGEMPHSTVRLIFFTDDGRQEPNEDELREIELAHRLYPEADVTLRFAPAPP
jgi:hypothetical protein